MVNETQSSVRSRSYDRNRSTKVSSSLGSGRTDSRDLRRSARETISKKQMKTSPSTTRKSERLGKQVPTPPVKRKPGGVDQQKTLSPLRRSDRAKKYTSSSSSGSKKNEVTHSSAGTKQKKGKKEIRGKKLIMEEQEVNGDENNGSKIVGKKRKNVDGRSYKARFKKQRIPETVTDVDEILEKPNNSSQADSSNAGGKAEEGDDSADVFSGRMGDELSQECANEVPEVALEKSDSSLNHVEVEMPGTSAEDNSADKLQIPVPLASTATGRNDEKSTPYKRKIRKTQDKPDASGTVVSKDTPVPTADAVLRPSPGCKVNDSIETCATCYKRRRLDRDSLELEPCVCNRSEVLRDPIIIEDSGELDGNMQRKESPLDIPLDDHKSVCVICNQGGKLLPCDGKDCRKCYHVTCLDPPLDEVPPGVWHCFWCVKKKIESGIHSVSKGVESIWDSKEMEEPDAEGSLRQKQYFVKFKGLAHIHNKWILETQLLHEAPLLLAKYNEKNQAMNWNVEWTVPHRLLMKRLVMPPKQLDEHCSRDASDISGCHCEWLVKWCCLGYEDCTWELDNASFLCSTEGRNPIREYENRHERAKQASLSLDENTKESAVKLTKLPGSSLPIDNNLLSAVNKLRESWHKGQNVILSDQEQVMKVVLFILSLSNVCQPFLIITTSSSISSWEAEFMRLAPSIDVVVYKGDRDMRRSIRILEFYEKGGCTMFQVLLSPPEVVVEDLEVLEHLRWEAIIIHECQYIKISTHFEKFKTLATGTRLLLFNGQIEDSMAEYLNVLSLLEFHGDLGNSDGLRSESNDNLGKLKERLSRFIANDCKSYFSRFIEYWVPVQISNVQLEQYCATLLSNSLSLCSCSKNDPVGALRELLISARKCCDHPYILDLSLKALITKGIPGLEYLDVEIKASGKLQLLDAILSESKKRQLRVLVLFQSIGGSGRNSIGDILDDLVGQRFGPDSYERIDGGVLASKKQAALNQFNNIESGRFVFLLETRACLPSIRLSSVDTVVIFNSDWNPANDIRALHKISIDSQSEQIKIFRLYSSCTVEEKVLILAKNSMTLDNNLHNINRSVSESLLMWGASYLFEKLDNFHSDNNPADGANIVPDQSFLGNVIKEFLDLLSQGDRNNDISSSTILKVEHIGGTYSTNLPLPGEQKVKLVDGEQSHQFWMKLLEGRNPRWKYSSLPTQRNRKRVQYNDNSAKKREVETDDAGKKRKKLVANHSDVTKHGLEEGNGSLSSPGTTTPASRPFITSNGKMSPEFHIARSEGRPLSNMQKSLDLLKPEISEVCEILKLPEDIMVMVDKFHDYVIMNHHISREPVSIWQAFQISLCWVAASLLKHKIDKKESLALAKQHLNFSCKEEEADYVYSKLRELKKMFVSHMENVKETVKETDALKASASTAEDITRKTMDGMVSSSLEFDPKRVKVEVEERNQEFPDEQNKMDENDIPKSVRRVQRKCEKRMANLLCKQEQEIEEFRRVWKEKMARVDKEHRMERAVVRSIHRHISVKMEKLNIVDSQFAKKREDHRFERDMFLRDLEAKHLVARNEERQKAADWLAEVKSCCDENINGLKDAVDLSDRVIEEQNSDGIVHRLQTSEALIANNAKSLQNESVVCEVPAEDGSAPLDANPEIDEVETMPLERISSSNNDESNKVVSCSSNSSEGVECGPPSGVLDGEVLRPEVPKILLNEVTGSASHVEMRNSDTEPYTENHRTNADSSGIRITVGDRIIEADCLIHCNSPSTEPATVKLPSDQPAASPSHNDPLPQNSDECSQAHLSTEIRDEDEPIQGSSQGIAVPSPGPVGAEQAQRSNHEESLSEPLEQLQPPLSMDLPAADRPAADGIAQAPERLTCVQNAEAPLDSEFLQQLVQRREQNLNPFSFTRPDRQPSSELRASPRGAGPPLFSHDYLSQTGANPSTIQGSSNLPMDAVQMPSQMRAVPKYSDPLQNELERIHKEIEQTVKAHEDTKLQLKSECEKEIEEIVAQIRRKYDAKLQEAESAFTLKKNELDVNQNRVFMNKILADAFRSKCMDVKPSPGSARMQQVMPSTFIQQMHRFTSQPIARPLSGLYSTVQPSSSQPIRIPHQPVVHHSSPLLSTPSTRPPHIGSLTPSTGNLRIASESRAPAPHLQRFRPSHANLSSQPRAMANHQSPIHLLSTSLSTPPIPTRSPPPVLPPPPPLAVQLPPPSPPAPPVAVHPSLLPKSNAAHPDSVEGFTSPNWSVPAVELLKDMDNNQTGAKRTTVLPPLADFGSTFDSLDLTEFGPPGGSAPPPVASNDVVCLSDDE